MTLASISTGLIAGTAGYRRATDAFSEHAMIEACLRFELALAETQGELHIIPQDAAARIAALCRIEKIDMEALAADAAQVGYAIVPLVALLADEAGPDGQWLHYGATSQDVMDTALVLQIRNTHRPLTTALTGVTAHLARLADRHRGSAMAGRSKLQHGAPITFGYRVAVWLDQVQRCADRLEQSLAATEVVQFGGAVGTLSALKEDGLAVRTGLARRLDLAEPDITWHVSRDRLAHLVFDTVTTLAALGKVAEDVIFMMATEVGELREPFAHGRGSSSTMPQKRNPVICEAILEAARMARALPAQLLDAMTQGQDRGIGHCYIEYRAIAEAIRLLAGAADLMNGLLEGLEVDTARMEHNLEASNGLIHAEAAMFALSDRHGRLAAHNLLHEMCREAGLNRRSLVEILAERGHPLSAEIFDPRAHEGSQPAMIDKVLGQRRT